MRLLATLAFTGLAWFTLTTFGASVHAHELLVKTGGKLNITITGANQSCAFQPLTTLNDGTVPTCAQACAAKGACASQSATNPTDDANICEQPMVSTFCFCCSRGTPTISPPAQLK